VSTQLAAQAVVNANLTDALAAQAAAALAAQAAQAEQAAAQAAAMSNVTDTLAAVLGGLRALQAGVGALAARMDAVETNMGLVDALVLSPPPPPPSPNPPPPRPQPPRPPPAPPIHVWTVGNVSTLVHGLHPAGSVFGLDGYLYVSSYGTHLISRVSPEGVVTTFAGSGTGTLWGPGAYADGQGTSASFDQPYHIAMDSYGTIYVAECVGRIRKISPSGIVSTFAGGGTSQDGVGTYAQFSYPWGITVDFTDQSVYVAERYTSRLRHISADGTVTTLSTSGLNAPWGLAVDSHRNLLIADSSGHAVRKLSLDTGMMTTLAALSYPLDCKLGQSGNLYVTWASHVSVITPAGAVTVLAGGGSGYVDGVGTNAGFWSVYSLSVDLDEQFVYVIDTDNNAIRKVQLLGDASP